MPQEQRVSRLKPCLGHLKSFFKKLSIWKNYRLTGSFKIVQIAPCILHPISLINTFIWLEYNVNQETDTGTLLLTRLLFTFLSFLHAFICVYLVPGNFIASTDSRNRDHNQDTKPFPHPNRIPLCDPFVFIPLPHLSSGNLWSALHLCNFVISIMLYKWNHNSMQPFEIDFFHSAQSS